MTAARAPFKMIAGPGSFRPWTSRTRLIAETVTAGSRWAVREGSAPRKGGSASSRPTGTRPNAAVSRPSPGIGVSAATRSSRRIANPRASCGRGRLSHTRCNAGTDARASPHALRKTKAPRSNRGADQHRNSIANGPSNRAPNFARDGMKPPGFSRRVRRGEEQGAQLATTSIRAAGALGLVHMSRKGPLRHTTLLPIRPGGFEWCCALHALHLVPKAKGVPFQSID